MDREELQKVWIDIIQKAWSDTAFKERLLTNPKAVFKEYGAEIPVGEEVKIMENTVNVSHFILPRPPDGELSDSDLKAVAGGTFNSNWFNTVH